MELKCSTHSGRYCTRQERQKCWTTTANRAEPLFHPACKIPKKKSAWFNCAEWLKDGVLVHVGITHK